MIFFIPFNSNNPGGGKDPLGKFQIVSSLILMLVTLVLWAYGGLTENFEVIQYGIGCLGLIMAINIIILLIAVINE